MKKKQLLASAVVALALTFVSVSPVPIQTSFGSVGSQQANAWVQWAVPTVLVLQRVISGWGLRVTNHVGQRMLERGITIQRMVQTLLAGRWFYDTASGATVVYYKGHAIFIRGIHITTSYFTSPQPTWR